MLTKYRVIKYSRSLLLKNFSTRVIDGRENNGSSSAAIIEKIEDLKNWKEELLKTMRIHPEFISEDEEKQLFNEIEPYIKRLRYEFSHWDDAIHGYRETEYARWNEDNKKIINRIREEAFPQAMQQLGLVHILDLAAEGWIKPHVDSVRFCGDIIAGLSLLSDCVMRLTMVGHEKDCQHDFLLPRRSLYTMSGVARFNYNHEVLESKCSFYNGEQIVKGRRISVICRSEPDAQKK